ncbi:MAG: YesL family protein [Lachnospiraceae bacterium]|nr:YesL family protein [Lachnospiraceae bacterium]
MRFFSTESALYRFVCKFASIIKLNFLWILFSLPIVTIGASTAAAFSVALKLAEDEEGYIFKGFVKGFKENWKQGTILAVITFVALYAIYMDFQLFDVLEDNPIVFLICGMLLVAFAYTAIIYAWPLIARYENTLMKSMKNSLDIFRQYFGRSMLMTLVLLLEIFFFLFNTTTYFFAIVIGPGMIIYTISAFSRQVFTAIEKKNQSGG